jgi:hypothetical protein
MPCLPKIDRPCPLARDAQRALAGHCGLCGHEVHALDALDDAQRRELLAGARGAVCVSYRVPAALAASLALLLTTPGAGAADGAQLPAPPPTPLIDSLADPPAVASPMSPTAGMTAADEDCASELEELEIMVGGVAAPHATEWFDIAPLPALPLRAQGVDGWD